MEKPGALLPPRTFPTAQEDAAKEEEVPHARYEGPESSYRLAFTDTDFLLREELRPVRMQLELLKPELVQNEQSVEATIVIFGSARILAPEVAQKELEAAQAAGDAKALRVAETGAAMSRFYDEARRFSAIVTRRSATLHKPLYVVTGGGPGIMEAGNRGAHEIGGKSIGLNIVLPHEQAPNPYITPDLCFQFHYFAIRKMHFLLRAKALVAFPGGFGTLDELTEILTLMQTEKIDRRIPIVLYGSAYWNEIIDFEALVRHGMIDRRDLALFRYADDPASALALLQTGIAPAVETDTPAIAHSRTE